MMQGSVISEWVNGFWAVSAFIAALVLADYIRREIRVPHYCDPMNRRWYRRLRVHLAAALGLWAVGDFIARGVLWRFRHLVNDGYIMAANEWLNSYWWLLIVGACFATAGIIMAVRAVTVQRCGEHVWITCGLIAFTVQMVLDLLS